MTDNRTTFEISVDLDAVPGTFHTVESARDVIESILKQTISHYNPAVTIKANATKAEPTIVNVNILHSKDPRENGNLTAWGIMSNDEYVSIVSWYADEIHIGRDEFVGLTRQEAINLKVRKDEEYLRS